MTRDDFRLEGTLVQYTSLLHFQADEDGACLRPSEVKPMLDRFVIRYVEDHGVAIEDIPESWKLDAPDGRIALRYKLQIRADEAKKKTRFNTQRYDEEKQKWKNISKPEEAIHPLYFGGMGDDNMELIGPGLRRTKIKGVSYPELQLTILVMTQGTVTLGGVKYTLKALLTELLPPFFALHCFGTRSGKGFGSFGVDSIKGVEKTKLVVTPDMLAAYLSKDVPALYWVGYGTELTEKSRLDDVNTLSMLMKSGFNYTHGNMEKPLYYKGMIIRYFLDQHVRSDKAAIKRFVLPCPQEDQRMIAAGKKIDTDADDQQDYAYVRGLLGITKTYEFRKDMDNEIIKGIVRSGGRVRSGKVDITGTEKKENKKPKIGRFGNPVHFKPHGKYLFLIPQPIPEKLRGATFAFSKQIRREDPEAWKNTRVLAIPKDFSLDAFLQYVAETYQTELEDSESKLNKLRAYDPKPVSAKAIADTLNRVRVINRAGKPQKGES